MALVEVKRTTSGDRYIGTLGLVDDAPTATVLPHFTNFPAGRRGEWVESVSNATLPSGRKIQVTEQYMCVVESAVAGNAAAWERRSPQIIKDGRISLFVKPGQIIEPRKPTLLKFLPDAELSGHPIYYDETALDIREALPLFSDPYKAVFSITLAVNLEQQPSGQVSTTMYSKLYEPIYDAGEKLNGKLRRGVALIDPDEAKADQYFGTFAQSSTPEGLTTTSFGRLNWADDYFGDFQTIVQAQLTHTAEADRVTTGGSLGFVIEWVRING
jgi:hypothetical protein